MRAGFRALMGVAVSATLAAGLGGCAGPSPVSGADGESSRSEAAGQAADALPLVEPGELTVACPLDCAPYFQDANGDRIGFACELMSAAAERMGLEISWSKADSADAAVERSASAGQQVRGKQVRADVALTVASAGEATGGGDGAGLAGLTSAGAAEVGDVVADEAAGTVKVPYLTVRQCLTVKKESGLESMDDLGGCRIGVLAGSPGEAWASASLPNVQQVAYNNVVDLFSALQARNVDAVIADEQAANYHLRVAYGDEQVVQAIEGSQASYALTFDAAAQPVAQAVADALRSLQEDGSYQRLYDAWFAAADNSRGKVEARVPEQGAPGHDKGGAV